MREMKLPEIFDEDADDDDDDNDAADVTLCQLYF